MKGKWRDKEFEITKVGTDDGYLYDLSDVELIGTYDYWEKLKHQYAGMAMQGILTNEEMQQDLYKAFGKNESMDVTISEFAISIANTLVEKLKNE